MSTVLLLFALHPLTLADCDREWKRSYGLPRARYAIVMNQPKVVKLKNGRRAVTYHAECYRGKKPQRVAVGR